MLFPTGRWTPQTMQCWEELGLVVSATPCMVHKPPSRLVSPQVCLPSSNSLSEGSSRTRSIFPHLCKADYISHSRVRIWKASITHLHLSDITRRAERATFLRACRPSSQDVRALLPLHPRRHIMSRGWRRLLPWGVPGHYPGCVSDLRRPRAWLATLRIQ